MKHARRIASAAILIGGIAASMNTAEASTVARWIQLGPGSSPSALAGGSYGDQPASLTPTILARALITARSAGCPSVALEDGSTLTMNPRFDGSTLTSGLPTVGGNNAFVTNTTPGNFAYGDAMATTDWTVCEAVVPANHVTATIDGVTLKLPVANPKRILVIADTGCRINGTGSQQDCHDPAAFPLAYMSNYQAQFAPDLIVHVGDYFYRDTVCSQGINSYGVSQNSSACNTPSSPAYVPWSDVFDSWNGDLFFPAATLLETAPWIMVRGNHESCGRGARGWFALLDPHPYNLAQVACAKNVGNTVVSGTTPVYTGDFTPSYVVPAGPVNFIVHDSSFANDAAVDTNMAKNYDLDLTALLAAVPANQKYVYATHKPTYGLVAAGYDSSGNANGGDFTEQFTFSGNASANSAFAGGVMPPSIAMLLSGHVHEFEYVNFANNTNFAPQLIVGMGGDNLDYTSNPAAPPAPTTVTASPVTGALLVNQFATASNTKSFDLHTSATGPTTTATVTNAYSQAEFGFAVLDATPTGYTASVYNLGNNKAGRCVITLSPRSIQCWK